MKYCVKCGTQNADSANFCTECGTALHIADTTANNDYTYESVENNSTDETTIDDTAYSYGKSSDKKENEVITYSGSSSEDKYTYTYNADTDSRNTYTAVRPAITPRNIVVAIILSFVTCGIYQIYWMIKMNDEVNLLSSEPDATNGIMVFLFTLITCGIYGFYWTYKMGERCDRIKGADGGSSAILYLILSVLGLGIVTYCLIQDTINKAV